MTDRWDETWHRLREWTNGQGPAERLAAQILLSEGFTSLDPSHPLGGRDGGKDAVAIKDGARWVMAAYFPRGQQSFGDIRDKFVGDHAGVAANDARGIAFVTNQEITVSERRQLAELVSPTPVEIFHIERITAILDQPAMHPVREQFLQISIPAAVADESSSADDALLIGAQELEENIEDLRRRVALAVASGVYWVDLLVWNIFEEHKNALKRYPEVYKPVSDAYRSFRELNDIVPASRLGTPIPDDEIGALQARIDQMAHASATLLELIAKLGR